MSGFGHRLQHTGVGYGKVRGPTLVTFYPSRGMLRSILSIPPAVFRRSSKMNDDGARGGTGMRPLTRIGLFAGILLAVFAAASLAGAAIDPGVDEPEGARRRASRDAGRRGARGSRRRGIRCRRSRPGHGRRRLPAGSGSDPSSTRDPDRASASASSTKPAPWSRTSTTEHERRMHLIVVRRDFAGFQHLHPEQRADGSWEVDIELERGGRIPGLRRLRRRRRVADPRHRSVRRRTPSAPCRCRASPRRPTSAADTRSRSTQREPRAGASTPVRVRA